LTFGLGIIILQGVSRRKYLAGVNIMGKFINTKPSFHHLSFETGIVIETQNNVLFT
jgi:hypothetical protein